MNKEFEFYHGVIFTKLIQAYPDAISLKKHVSTSAGAYILNKKIGIYIKYSKKRLSPWQFSFLKSHQIEILKLKEDVSHIFTLLVCGDDGIVVLNYDELKALLDEEHKETEWITASRSRNKEYTLKGSDGELKRKIAKNCFPRKIMDFEF